MTDIFLITFNSVQKVKKERTEEPQAFLAEKESASAILRKGKEIEDTSLCRFYQFS
jgi:hypothetical protein